MRTVSRRAADRGATLAATYRNDQVLPHLRAVTDALGCEILVPCDVRIAAEADEESRPMPSSRDVRLIGEATGLTQTGFATRDAIVPSRLRDWEQARFKPDSVALAYLKLIRHDPHLAARVAGRGKVTIGSAPRQKSSKSQGRQSAIKTTAKK